MIVNEIFYSLQGEGFLAGVPSAFVRLAGCPLRCRWCDTKYALSESAGEDWHVDEIIEKVGKYPGRFVVVTGGEPMISPELTELVRRLRSCGKHITIETAGIAYVPDLSCDLMSISPKLSNSTPASNCLSEAGPEEAKLTALHEDSRLDIAVLRELIDNYEYQLKFVVDSQDDLTEIRQTIEETGNINPEKVMLMPQAASRQELLAKSEMVAELCRKSGFAFCQRLQVLLWNNEKSK